MRAIVITNHHLEIGEAERPTLGADDLRIAVRATSVNRADLLQAAGRYPPPPGASPILGLECAGVVAEVGANLRGWAVGDRAMALLPGGGYAAEVVVHAGSAMHVHALGSFLFRASAAEWLDVRLELGAGATLQSVAATDGGSVFASTGGLALRAALGAEIKL